MKNRILFGIIFSISVSFFSSNAHIYQASLWQDSHGNYVLALHDAHNNLSDTFDAAMKQQTEALLKAFDNNDSHIILEHLPDFTVTPTQTEIVRFLHTYKQLPLTGQQIKTYEPPTKIVDPQATSPQKPASISHAVHDKTLLQHHCQSDGSCTAELSFISPEASYDSQKNIACLLRNHSSHAIIDPVDPRAYFTLSKINTVKLVTALKTFDTYMAATMAYNDGAPFMTFYRNEYRHYLEWRGSLDILLQKNKNALIQHTQQQFEGIPTSLLGKKIIVNEDNLRNIVSLHDLLQCPGIPKEQKHLLQLYENFGVEIEALHSLRQRPKQKNYPYTVICCGGFHTQKIENLLAQPDSGYTKVAQTHYNREQMPIHIGDFIERLNTKIKDRSETFSPSKPEVWNVKILQKSLNL